MADDPPTWDEVRAAFDLTPDYIHLGAAQFLVSHPAPVREAIERWRRALDDNPVLVVEANEDPRMQQVRDAAARRLGGVEPNEIALTDSTTMGLGLLYAGLAFRAGDEVVASDHEHYSHLEALRGAGERTGAVVRKVTLYPDSAADADPQSMIERLLGAIRPRTRAVAVTWVHSDTGLKFPVARLAAALAEINRERETQDRVLLCVDGVHGFGIETDTVADLGCDVFVSGTHKWMFGPRGTGLLWGDGDVWKRMHRVIPSFTETMDAYSEDDPLPVLDGRQFTPGGFHSLEHRWAAVEAFAFHDWMGPERVAARVHELNRRAKQGLAAMDHVTVHTPMDDALSAGIVAFEVAGLSSDEARKRLLERRIVATVAPYPTAYLRLTPGVFNTPQEVDLALAAIAELA